MNEEIKREPDGEELIDQELNSRRAFLRSLGRWSSIIIGTLALGGLMPPQDAAGWVNGGAAWVNGRGGGGAGWVNRAGGGGAWVNARVGGGGAAWVNRAGGGGGSWVNRRGW
jgi:hypothetical protein